jgi:hypothetical protein
MLMPEHLKNIRVDSLELARVAGELNRLGVRMRDGKPFRADAGETALFARQLEYIRTKTYDVVYAETKALKYLPVSTDVPDGADSYVMRQWDMAGYAKIISSFADDLPSVTLLAQERAAKIVTLGNSYHYSIEEMKAAAYAGVPLTQKKAQAARMIHERKVDDLASSGDTDAGLDGFINNANVTLVPPVNGDWDGAATSDEILEDLYELEWSIVIASKELFAPDTLLMAPEAYKILATKPYSTTIPDSILTIFLRNAKFIRTVDQWHKLTDADAEGDGPRLIAYKKDPTVVEIVIPRPFTQEPPQVRNLSWVVNCHSRIGGVQIHYPLGIAYMDAVLDA